MPRREDSLKRRGPVRSPRRKFLLYCEGKKTEPAYFDFLRRRWTDVDVEIIGDAGDPSVIAAKTVEAQSTRSRRKARTNSYEEHDQVWAVFDRDSHEHFGEPIALCERNGVHVARSNPCFEVWLILHMQNYDKPDDRHAVQALLRKLRPEYDPKKGKTPDSAALCCFVEDAERRAEVLLARREEEDNQYGPPSTTVGRLTRALREAANNAARRT